MSGTKPDFVETKMSASTMATIGKTPSDNRAGSNNVGMINKIML